MELVSNNVCDINILSPLQYEERIYIRGETVHYQFLRIISYKCGITGYLGDNYSVWSDLYLVWEWLWDWLPARWWKFCIIVNRLWTFLVATDLFSAQSVRFTLWDYPPDQKTSTLYNSFWHYREFGFLLFEGIKSGLPFFKSIVAISPRLRQAI